MTLLNEKLREKKLRCLQMKLLKLLSSALGWKNNWKKCIWKWYDIETSYKKFKGVILSENFVIAIVGFKEFCLSSENNLAIPYFSHIFIS